MDGYRPESYGEAIADVYDEWYPMDAEGEAAVERLFELARGGRVLELGVGTGKLAIPLAARGLEVWGLDSSPAMLERLRTKPGGDEVHTVLGDMANDLPDGPFSLVFVATNTFFGLCSVEEQQAAFAAVAERLDEDGRFLVDAFVPDDPPRASSVVEVQKVTLDGVLLAISDADIPSQTAWGQMVEIRADGITLRPWKVRWSTPAELDAMASTAGLELVERHATWEKDAYTDDSANHVSVYGRSSPAGLGSGVR
ncbi:MAG TPA: class I SAM-dependent methyltransferase [Acidimicrobiales bacterium]|nr:class I SAM-dependent methyltransferase [Acidimicrobiales bacterium]